MAAKIPGAKYIEYPDGDHIFCSGETDALLGDIQEFVTGVRETPRATWNAFSQRFCSPTSSIRRAAPPRRATMRGADCWTIMIAWPNRPSRNIGDP